MTNHFIADCCKNCERFDVKENRKRNELRCALDCKKPKEFGKAYAKHTEKLLNEITFKWHDRNGRYCEEVVEAKGEDVDGMDLKPCPFCGGKGKVSFKDHKFYGKNGFGDKKIKYRVQVICNKCRSRGKPVITDWLINPNPYISKWGNCGDGTSPNGYKQTQMFQPYVEQAIEAWNWRKDG